MSGEATRILFSCIPDRETSAIILSITFRYAVRCKGRIKIFTIIDPVDYRIFLEAPIGFHEFVSGLIQKNEISSEV